MLALGQGKTESYQRQQRTCVLVGTVRGQKKKQLRYPKSAPPHFPLLVAAEAATLFHEGSSSCSLSPFSADMFDGFGSLGTPNCVDDWKPWTSPGESGTQVATLGYISKLGAPIDEQ